jgi:hypothetical protein
VLSSCEDSRIITGLKTHAGDAIFGTAFAAYRGKFSDNNALSWRSGCTQEL